MKELEKYRQLEERVRGKHDNVIDINDHRVEVG